MNSDMALFLDPIMQRGGAFGAMLSIALLFGQVETALAQQQHTLPLVTSADSAQQSFLRIINRSNRAGTASIRAIDDTGRRFGPATLDLEAEETVHLNSMDLEIGNSDKGLSGDIGDGVGDWRLELNTELDIELLAYIRTTDGFVTSMHDVVQPEYVPGTPGVDDFIRHNVRFFNPGSNTSQVSRLRVINTASVDNVVTITGVDDAGEPAPGGEVTLTLSPYQARTISAQQLEAGADFLTGSLGNGTGKWQLTITPEFRSEEDRRGARPIQVMNLLLSVATQNLANLSALGDGNDSNRGGDGSDRIWGGGGDDVLNPGDNDDNVDAVFGSAGDDTIVYTDSGPSAFQWLGYFGLGNGVRATINGVTNVGTVTKGTSGTDTIVDIKNPLDAARNAPYGAFGLGGTHFDDRFDLTLADGQWMDVRGEAGNDTINIVSGHVQINYRHTTNGVDVDLGAGIANDDGFGDVDTIIGDVRQLQGGLGDDTLKGGSGGDRIDGGPGDDTINPGESACDSGREDHIFGSLGDDEIVYTDVGAAACGSLYYGVPWRGSSTISEGVGIDVTINGVTNRGTVNKGDDGTDTLVDIATQLNAAQSPPYGGFTLYGSFSDDVIDLTLGEGQFMQVRGLAGNDTFYLSGGNIRLDYRGAPGGIDADLGAGTVSNDGYGDVDTIRTAVYEFHGSEHADVIVGSANDESFTGRGGNDRIDGGGGYDRLRFDRSGVAGVQVDLSAGTATGIWDGMAFSYTISNFERIEGSRGDDELVGSGRDDRLRGREGSDRIEGREGNDRLEGGDGDDILVGGPGENRYIGGDGDDTFVIGFRDGASQRIDDFTNGEDRIDLNAWGISSHSDVIAVVSIHQDNDGVWIDLTRFAGGGIFGIHLYGYFDTASLDASDFLL